MYMDTTKKIILPTTTGGSVKISNGLTTTSYDFDKQMEMVEILYEKLCNSNDVAMMENPRPLQTIIQQLQKKIAGYKSQDVKKRLYNPDRFVKLEDVVKQLWDAKLQCIYCKKQVYVLYEIVREVHQWTLDRINNSYGHNRDNVMISCLECNVRRGTMYHERYAFTKTFTQVKKLD